MTQNFKRARQLGILSISGFALSLTGCASGGAAHQPIVDGPKDAVYHADLKDCRTIAESREYLNSDTQTAAAVGAGLGGIYALAGTRNGDADDFIAGAIVGAIFGGGDSALQTRGERKSILLNCMAGRGHRILG